MAATAFFPNRIRLEPEITREPYRISLPVSPAEEIDICEALHNAMPRMRHAFGELRQELDVQGKREHLFGKDISLAELFDHVRDQMYLSVFLLGRALEAPERSKRSGPFADLPLIPSERKAYLEHGLAAVKWLKTNLTSSDAGALASPYALGNALSALDGCLKLNSAEIARLTPEELFK